ncbi:hypothetical protein QKA_3055 [Clostridioides difficile DA00165]|nr:hypothetical protein QKA_3055 [Clostridioides difficile DA00165]
MSELSGKGCEIIVPFEERLPVRDIEKSIIYRKNLWSKFMKAIRDYKLVEEGDKIAVAISGGKDSILMAKMFQEFMDKLILILNLLLWTLDIMQI